MAGELKLDLKPKPELNFEEPAFPEASLTPPPPPPSRATPDLPATSSQFTMGGWDLHVGVSLRLDPCSSFLTRSSERDKQCLRYQGVGDGKIMNRWQDGLSEVYNMDAGVSAQDVVNSVNARIDGGFFKASCESIFVYRLNSSGSRDTVKLELDATGHVTPSMLQDGDFVEVRFVRKKPAFDVNSTMGGYQSEAASKENGKKAK